MSDQHHLFTASRFPTPSVQEEHCFLIHLLLLQTLQSHSKKITQWGVKYWVNKILESQLCTHFLFHLSHITRSWILRLGRVNLDANWWMMQASSALKQESKSESNRTDHTWATKRSAPEGTNLRGVLKTYKSHLPEQRHDNTVWACAK